MRCIVPSSHRSAPARHLAVDCAVAAIPRRDDNKTSLGIGIDHLCVHRIWCVGEMKVLRRLVANPSVEEYDYRITARRRRCMRNI